MDATNSTCWQLIDDAAGGAKAARTEFVERYSPVIRAYLMARWRNGNSAFDFDDATQEVFLECFREGGALSRLDNGHAGGFRAFFYGVVRNVARRVENDASRRRERQPPSSLPPAEIVADEATLSRVFDRAYAQALVREASALLRQRAKGSGDRAVQRVELLRLRFEDELPIRRIAELWNVDAAHLHHEYARARDEFKEALIETLSRQQPGIARGELERECFGLLALLA